MIRRSIVEIYAHDNNKNLTPVGTDSKIPILKGWTSGSVNINKLYEHAEQGGNLGWVLGVSDLVIDIDVKNNSKGVESYGQLVKDLNLSKLQPAAITPSGGYHIYLTIPPEYQNKKFRKNLPNYPGIDFLTKGAYCLIVDSTFKGNSYRWYRSNVGFIQHEAPPELLKTISASMNTISEQVEPRTTTVANITSDGSIVNIKKDEIEKMLVSLDPSMGYQDWIKVGMALHHWDPTDTGLQVWEEWSCRGSNYQQGVTREKWLTFGNTATPITVMTLFKMASVIEKQKKMEAIDQIVATDEKFDYTSETPDDSNAGVLSRFIDIISNADEVTLRTTVIPQIKNIELSRYVKERLAFEIQQQFKKLIGTKIPLVALRNEIGLTSKFAQSQIPAWVHEWVYVSSHDIFFNVITKAAYNTKAFNLLTTQYVPVVSETGSRPSAIQFVTNGGLVPVADSLVYMPTEDRAVLDIDNRLLVNTFDKSTLPKAADHIGISGNKYIDTMTKHIKILLGSEEKLSILLQWMAHQVQYPGHKLLWAPIIQGVQGIGKTYIGEVLRACLGDCNVGLVSAKDVISDNNGWASGVCVNVLEELKIQGHNRYEVVNALKPLITDRMISITDKWVKKHKVYNTANYICFTNHRNALPLETEDRRWWVIFSPVENKTHITKLIGETYDGYFIRLYKGLGNHSADIRRWFLDYTITQEFKERTTAPSTDEKVLMISTEYAKYDGIEEIELLINEGGKFYNREVVCAAELFNDLVQEGHIMIPDSQKRELLQRLGYMALPQPIKIEGKTRRFWAKKLMTTAEIREALFEYNR